MQTHSAICRGSRHVTHRVDIALNAQARTQVAALCFEIPATLQADAPPKRISLIPAPQADGRLVGADGRTWTLADPAKVVAAFNRHRAITENHSRVLAAPNGGASPAFGWIDALHVAADGGIDADVSWTPRGATALAARDYRYLSPEFEFDKAGQVLAVVGAALTNDPNFPQLALNQAEQVLELSMNLKAIAVALGLNPEADEASILAAIKAMQGERQTAMNAAQHPDPNKFVPVEQHHVALNAKAAAESQLTALMSAQRDAEITGTVDAAMKAGKIVPATRDYYLAMCRSEGGLDQFKQFVAVAPVIGDVVKLPVDTEAKGANGLTPAELAICHDTGITAEQFLAARA